MKVRVPDYYKNFKCIASQCEDTCCAGWGVVIDDETYNNYKNLGGKFGERLRSEIECDEGDNIFKLKNDNCAFLNEKKLCDIYNQLGENGLCYVCRQFPRVMEEFGALREIGLSLSCPEAARLILNQPKKIEFQLSENDQVIVTYNDIDKQHFTILNQCRDLIINIIQNPSISIGARASLILQFTDQVQDKIDWDEMDAIRGIIDDFSKEKFIEDAVKNLSKYKHSEKTKYYTMFQWLNVYKNLTHINENDPLELDNAINCFYDNGENWEFYSNKHSEFEDYYQNNLYKFEHMLVYFVFRYFMKSIFDYNAIAEIKISVVSLLMIKELCVVRWIDNKGKFTDKDMVDIAHMYSKDIEHLEENIDVLTDVFEDNDMFTTDNILVALMN